jgi:hypothetical protein
VAAMRSKRGQRPCLLREPATQIAGELDLVPLLPRRSDCSRLLEFPRSVTMGAMRYLRWHDQFNVFGMVELWTEVDDTGTVSRELAFDSEGHIGHRCASSFYRHGTYGLFDMAPVEIAGTQNELDPHEFEETWRQDELAD